MLACVLTVSRWMCPVAASMENLGFEELLDAAVVWPAVWDGNRLARKGLLSVMEEFLVKASAVACVGGDVRWGAAGRGSGEASSTGTRGPPRAG